MRTVLFPVKNALVVRILPQQNTLERKNTQRNKNRSICNLRTRTFTLYISQAPHTWGEQLSLHEIPQTTHRLSVSTVRLLSGFSDGGILLWSETFGFFGTMPAVRR